MDKFKKINWGEKFTALGAKLGSNKILSAMRDSFMLISGLLIAGSIPYVISLVFFKNGGLIGGFHGTKNSEFFIWSDKYLSAPLKSIWDASKAIFTIIFVLGMGFFLAQTYKTNQAITMSVTLAAFWIMGPQRDGDYIGTKGLLLAIPISIFAPLMFSKWAKVERLKIKLPPQVPPIFAKVFASLFAIILTLLPFVIINYAFIWIADAANLTEGSHVVYKPVAGTNMFIKSSVATHYTSLFKGMDVLLAEPFSTLSQNIGTTAIIAFMIAFFWFFGVHGTNIMNPITKTLWVPLVIQNTEYWDKYLSLPGPKNYWDTTIVLDDGTILHGLNIVPLQTLAYIGGTGATLALVILTLMFVRFVQHRELAKVSLLPGIFGINEPVNFGYPIVLNPAYAIPYVFGFSILMTLGEVWIYLHWMRPVVVIPPSMPPGLDSFFATAFDYRSLLFTVLHLTLSFAIWIPFLKIGVKNSMIMAGEKPVGDEVSWKLVRRAKNSEK